MDRIRLGMVGGGKDAFIGAVHRIAARIDGQYDLVAGALSASPDKARESVLKGWRERYGDKDGRFTLYAPVGCDSCTGGYRGRLGLHELMIGSDRVKELIQERARVANLLSVALEEGMRTLRQDGIEKVMAGLTDLKQVRKVCIR